MPFNLRIEQRVDASVGGFLTDEALHLALEFLLLLFGQSSSGRRAPNR
jgi:hypothetical protein